MAGLNTWINLRMVRIGIGVKMFIMRKLSLHLKKKKRASNFIK